MSHKVSALEAFTVAMPTKDTEYEFTIPAGTGIMICRPAAAGDIKLSWSKGLSGTQYYPIPQGAGRPLELRDLAFPKPQTIYFQSAIDNNSLCILIGQ